MAESGSGPLPLRYSLLTWTGLLMLSRAHRSEIESSSSYSGTSLWPNFLLHYPHAHQSLPHGHLSRRRQCSLLALRPQTASLAPPAQGLCLPRHHRLGLPLLRSPRRVHLVHHYSAAAHLRPRYLASPPRRQRLDRRASRKIPCPPRLASA